MTERQDVFDQAMGLGHSAAWDQQWDQAIDSYRQALQEFPDDPAALASLGFALLQANSLDEALKCYQRAAALDPSDPIAPEKSGEILERQGRLNDAAQTYLAVAEAHIKRRDIQKAVANWERVVRLTPNNLAAHSRLALAAERTGHKQQAVMEYIEVARIFQRAGDNANAVAAASRAQQVDPQAPQPREALERIKQGILLPAGRRAGAASKPPGSAFAPIDEHPANGTNGSGPHAGQTDSPMHAARSVALGLLAELLFDDQVESGKGSTSIGALMSGAGKVRGDQAKRAQALRALGQAIDSQTTGDAQAAIGHYQAALNAGLESPVVNFVLGALQLDERKRGEAIKWFKRAVQHEAVGVGALYGLGQAEYHEGQLKPALTHLLDAMRRLDRDMVPASQQEALDEAYEALADSLQTNDPQAAAPIVTGLLKLMSGDGWEERLRQAREQLDEAGVDGTPAPLADLLAVAGAGDAIDSLRSIEAHMREGLWATAMEEAYFALGRSPTHLPIHVRMAEILSAENKPQAAIDKYSAVAETYRIRGEPARAARMMQRALQLTPLDVSMRTWLIELLVQQGKVNEALQQYHDLADTYYQLADLEAARNAYSEGLLLAEKQRSGADWRLRLLHKIGDIDLQRLNWREAQRVYEQIRDVAPDDHSGRATLIDLLFRLDNHSQALAEIDSYLRRLLANGSLAIAVNLLEEVNQAQPDEPPVVARLARLYQDSGQRLLAIHQYDRLGELQLQAGQSVQAAETIRTILALEPEDPSGYQQLLAELQVE